MLFGNNGKCFLKPLDAQSLAQDGALWSDLCEHPAADIHFLTAMRQLSNLWPQSQPFKEKVETKVLHFLWQELAAMDLTTGFPAHLSAILKKFQRVEGWEARVRVMGNLLCSVHHVQMQLQELYHACLNIYSQRICNVKPKQLCCWTSIVDGGFSARVYHVFFLCGAIAKSLQKSVCTDARKAWFFMFNQGGATFSRSLAAHLAMMWRSSWLGSRCCNPSLRNVRRSRRSWCCEKLPLMVGTGRCQGGGHSFSKKCAPKLRRNWWVIC